MWQRPALMVRGLFSVLIAVPVLAVAIARGFELPRAAQIGIVLMAISPGAPVALRRSLVAGGHRVFAPCLQISVILLAVFSMPMLIALLNHVYAGHAVVEPWQVAQQVFIVQVLPLGLGMALRRTHAAFAEYLTQKLVRINTGLIAIVTVLIVINIWEVTVNAGFRSILAIVLTTGAALAIGHMLGGPEPATRTATAIISAARNPGLALLVATLNNAPSEIIAIILAYLLISALAIAPYIRWRQSVDKKLSQTIDINT